MREMWNEHTVEKSKSNVYMVYGKLLMGKRSKNLANPTQNQNLMFFYIFFLPPKIFLSTYILSPMYACIKFKFSLKDEQHDERWKTSALLFALATHESSQHLISQLEVDEVLISEVSVILCLQCSSLTSNFAIFVFWHITSKFQRHRSNYPAWARTSISTHSKVSRFIRMWGSKLVWNKFHLSLALFLGVKLKIILGERWEGKKSEQQKLFPPLYSELGYISTKAEGWEFPIRFFMSPSIIMRVYRMRHAQSKRVVGEERRNFWWKKLKLIENAIYIYAKSRQNRTHKKSLLILYNLNHRSFVCSAFNTPGAASSSPLKFNIGFYARQKIKFK